jgi:hypothetical protein
LSISSDDKTGLMTLFYRDPHLPEAQQLKAPNDLAVILELLGGGEKGKFRGRFSSSGEAPPSDPLLPGPAGGGIFSFAYSDVVAIAEKLVENHQVYGMDRQGQQVACAFQLQHPAEDSWISIPMSDPSGRPQGDGGVTPLSSPAKPVSGANSNGAGSSQAASAGRF